MNWASATEAVDLGSIPCRVKPKTIRIDIHSFLLDVQQLKGQCEAPVGCGKTGRQVAAWLEDRKFFSLSPGQDDLVNKM